MKLYQIYSSKSSERKWKIVFRHHRNYFVQRFFVYLLTILSIGNNSLTLLSSHSLPFSAMRVYLKQLYSLSLSPLQLPLESFISCIISRIPAPLPGGRSYHVILDLDLIPSTSQPMSPIIFDLPSHYSFPFNETQLSSILKFFTIENILMVFFLLLKESKVIFISHSSTLLTEVMETFRLLLFPLKWTSTYITKLPEKLKDVLHAPGGYMIGIQNLISTLQLINPDIQIFLRKFHLPEQCYVVDILHNKIFCHHHQKFDYLSSSKINSSLKTFSQHSLRQLSSRLQSISTTFHRVISLQYSNTNVDSVFEMKLSTSDEDLFFDNEDDDQDEQEITREHQGDQVSDHDKQRHQRRSQESNEPSTLNKLIRDSFLGFMCDLLGDFGAYFRPEIARGVNYGHPSDSSDLPHTSSTSNHTSNYNPILSEVLDLEAYVNDSDRSQRQLLHVLFETQMFTYLIQQWKEEPSLELCFFYDAMRYQKVLGLSAVPNDKRIPSKSTYPELLLDSIRSADAIDESIPLCDYVDSIRDLLSIFSSSRKVLSLPQIFQTKKNREFSLQKESTSNGVHANVVKCTLSCFSLTDRSLGSLILPGPSALNEQNSVVSSNHNVDIAFASFSAQAADRSSPIITHHHIWPNLNQKYFANQSQSQSQSQLGLIRLLEVTANIRCQVSFPLPSTSDYLCSPLLPPRFSFTTHQSFQIAFSQIYFFEPSQSQ